MLLHFLQQQNYGSEINDKDGQQPTPSSNGKDPNTFLGTEELEY